MSEFIISQSSCYAMPYKRKGLVQSGKYQVCVKYQLVGSTTWKEKRKVVTAVSDKTALKLAEKFRADLLAGKVELSPSKVDEQTEHFEQYLTLNDCLPDIELDMRNNNRTAQSIEQTIRLFKVVVCPVVGNLPVDAIGYNEVQLIRVAFGKQGWSDSTKNVNLGRLHAILGALVRLGKRTTPLPEIERFKVKIRYTAKHKRLNYSDLEINNARKKAQAIGGSLALVLEAFLLLGAHCGARVGEVLGLTWGQVNLTEETITLDRQRDPKNAIRAPKGVDNNLVVGISSELLALLQALKAARKPSPNDLVLLLDRKAVRVDGKTLSFRMPRVGVTSHGDMLGRPTRNLVFGGWMPYLMGKGSVHGLRRYAITTLAKRGLDLSTLKEFARHASLDTTLEYVKTTKEDLKKASKLF